jgi:hypothetical protein
MVTEVIRSESEPIGVKDQTFVVTTVEAVETVESGMFEIRLTLHDSSTLTLIMEGQTLCKLADQVSQYATP